MRFAYTILYVEDVARSLAFFHDAFGFDSGFVDEGGDYGELDTGETRLAFSSRALMRQLGKMPGTPEPNAPVFEIAIETTDVAATLERACTAGAVVVQEPREESWGQTTAYVRTPDGYLVELCSPVAMPS
ncbi:MULTISPECIES: VOC family protein [Marichromatium]|uniref:Putative enzyme related to lactoylglutathione lyase n=1 Tax=Marichromatium gracile TaxID=1048 RepID=A0A4R4A6B1_MARGR|nr:MULTISPECIES: VOC family protein [Marichromatium]MBK1708686.1 glyoxalase [Marichromatium gracile]RNE91067.1 VOC family protein [Marichromatium sp. AB31]TCW34298.1 putative enzyme related to lactoylglutathione lyase [Marichromatium gracile]